MGTEAPGASERLRTYISRLERGERNATLSKVDELASVMGLHPATLVTLSYLPSLGSTAELDKLLSRVREEVICLSANGGA
jgi:hypothetical protein